MPLTKSGHKVMGSMKKKYGKRAKEVFYASINKKVAGSEKWHVKGLGEAIENTGGDIGIPKDLFSHNVNDKASEKPRGSAIDSPKYNS